MRMDYGMDCLVDSVSDNCHHSPPRKRPRLEEIICPLTGTSPPMNSWNSTPEMTPVYANFTVKLEEVELPDVKPLLPRVKPSGACYRCPICGDTAWIKHFGSLSCNACAGFFRRSVSYRKAYFCKHNGRCVLNHKSKQHMCQYCRFQACMGNGMQVSGVTKIHCEPGTADSTMKKLVQCRSANFVNRTTAYRCVLAKNSFYGHEPHQLAVPSTSHAAVMSELCVMDEYIRTCGILDALPQSPVRGEVLLQSLKLSFFYTWIVYELVTNTLRHDGHHNRRVYFMNDTIYVATERGLLEYYRKDEQLLDPATVAIHSLDYFDEILSLTRVYKRAGLDEVEQCVLLQLMLAKAAAVLLGEKQVNGYVDLLFKELNDHYEQNYNETAVRLGNVVLLMRDLQRLRHVCDEHIAMMKLSGKRTVLEGLRAA